MLLLQAQKMEEKARSARPWSGRQPFAQVRLDRKAWSPA